MLFVAVISVLIDLVLNFASGSLNLLVNQAVLKDNHWFNYNIVLLPVMHLITEEMKVITVQRALVALMKLYNFHVSLFLCFLGWDLADSNDHDIKWYHFIIFERGHPILIVSMYDMDGHSSALFSRKRNTRRGVNYL